MHESCGVWAISDKAMDVECKLSVDDKLRSTSCFFEFG